MSDTTDDRVTNLFAAHAAAFAAMVDAEVTALVDDPEDGHA